jgi:hypothetical protein
MKNWTNDDFLEYLMTSDYEDNLSPEDYKTLLSKFRTFYRIVSSRSTNIEIEKKKFNFEIEQLNTKYTQDLQHLNDQIQLITIKYQSLVTRKLSFKERLLGKISLNKNEEI